MSPSPCKAAPSFVRIGLKEERTGHCRNIAITRKTLNERNGLWVLKKSLNRTPFHLRAGRRRSLISVRLSGSRQDRCCRLTEEAHQSFDVLSYRCQEELLAHEPESPQTQAPQSDQIL